MSAKIPSNMNIICIYAIYIDRKKNIYFIKKWISNIISDINQSKLYAYRKAILSENNIGKAYFFFKNDILIIIMAFVYKIIKQINQKHLKLKLKNRKKRFII